jgi:hypothetical protein
MTRASTSYFSARGQDVDGRVKPGHDDIGFASKMYLLLAGEKKRR